ncbi:MAG: hydrogenase iron-sulfur subunit [Proteobacteria bacterium]|nr:hydrogenase iron-sulfur subunit [Pseudomonadota bacterium]
MPEAEKKKSDNQERRVGVFVCHCGLNIGGVVDCKAVAEYAARLPDVVYAVDNLYTCSDPGQAQIKDAIAEHKLNRVVVASCTPRLHEPTFRATVAAAGLNPYLFEMANIREHCSWVHLHEKDGATEKAKDLIRMAVSRSRLLTPQTEIKVPVTRRALVLGGGVAGIQSALDLADSGYEVYLIERSASIGGRMAQIDKTFPTMDCSICILAPKMSEVGRHPNIHLMTLSELESVEGYVGNFKARVRRLARFVTNECTSCGDCVAECPQLTPDDFNAGLSTRRAIFIPFAQAVPSSYLIDMSLCLNKEGIIACDKCYQACQHHCIDYNQQDEILNLEVGTIIVATGMDVYDPTPLTEFGYRKFPNVLTSLEFERLINAGGPSGGNLIRPSDGGRPKRVAFLQCIGSRSYRSNVYCSSICCMNTIKDVLLIKEHWPETEVSVHYIDIRAYGKGFEELFRRARMEGVLFIRGLPGEIIEDYKTRNLTLIGEDTLQGEIYKKEVDMVILSVGLEPRQDSEAIQRLLNLSCAADGFFLEAHPKLRPVDTPVYGVFLAGCAEGPKDIKESVTQASAAASRANILMSAGEVTVEAITASVNPDRCMGCGLCEPVCPFKSIRLEGEGKERKAFIIEASCQGCGTCAAECQFGAIDMKHFNDQQILAQIDAATEKEPEKLVVAFCCNWCSYAGADFAGVSRMQYPTPVRIIRTMCSGRVSTRFIAEAFVKGAAAVLVSGCHPADCHYIDANLQTEKRVNKLWKRMEKAGLDPKRLQLAWISAAEGNRFAEKISEMNEIIQKVTPAEIQTSREFFRPKKKE